MPRHSAQKVYGGGKFKSERQRRAMWANSKSAAEKWAHNLSAAHDPSWAGMRRTAFHSGGPGLAARSAVGKAARRGGRGIKKSGSTATKQRSAAKPSHNRNRRRKR